MPMTRRFKERDDSRRVEMVPGVFRQVLACGERAMVVQISMNSGAVVPMHTHPHEQSGYIASGVFRFTIGDETRDLRPGDGYSIPGGVPHGGTALDENTVAVDTFAPPREEYHE
jgi:quercetin dioxygenase-like cupin family protein